MFLIHAGVVASWPHVAGSSILMRCLAVRRMSSAIQTSNPPAMFLIPKVGRGEDAFSKRPMVVDRAGMPDVDRHVLFKFVRAG